MGECAVGNKYWTEKYLIPSRLIMSRLMIRLDADA